MTPQETTYPLCNIVRYWWTISKTVPWLVLPLKGWDIQAGCRFEVSSYEVTSNMSTLKALIVPTAMRLLLVSGRLTPWRGLNFDTCCTRTENGKSLNQTKLQETSMHISPDKVVDGALHNFSTASTPCYSEYGGVPLYGLRGTLEVPTVSCTPCLMENVCLSMSQTCMPFFSAGFRCIFWVQP